MLTVIAENAVATGAPKARYRSSAPGKCGTKNSKVKNIS